MILKITARVKKAMAIKGPEFYTWYEYTSGDSVSFVTTRGKRPVTLKKGTIYGVRPSHSGKETRMVVQQADMNNWINIVYTINEKAELRITNSKYCKGISQPSIVTAKEVYLQTAKTSEKMTQEDCYDCANLHNDNQHLILNNRPNKKLSKAASKLIDFIPDVLEAVERLGNPNQTELTTAAFGTSGTNNPNYVSLIKYMVYNRLLIVEQKGRTRRFSLPDPVPEKIKKLIEESKRMNSPIPPYDC